MAESLKSLRRRVRTISSTQQITRAMEMVSAAKLRRAQGVLFAARPYIRHLEILLGRLAPIGEIIGHPLFVQRKVERATVVLFTADRGLCGSYNAGLIRIAEKHLKEHACGQIELVCVGRAGFDYFLRRAWPIAEKFAGAGGALDHEASADLSHYLCDRFLTGKTDEIYLLSSAFVSTAVSKPAYEKFLHLDSSMLLRKASPDDRAPIDYIYEPDRERIFERMLPAYLEAKIFITLAESSASEHAARMIAMNNASNNCDEMVNSLTLQLNKARQSAITGDLLDIVGGAEALQTV